MEQQKVRRSNTILIKAVEEQNYEAINNLLQRGSNVNKVDDEGNSPLHRAVQLNDFKIIEILLRDNAQMDIENNHGHSPYYYVLNSCDVNILNVFLKYKAEVSIDDICKINLSNAFPENLKKVLYENVNLENADSVGHNALHYAVEYDDLNEVRTLISRGADVNKVTERGKFTPLHLARSTECIKILLRAGAEPNFQNEHQTSPLHKLVGDSKIRSGPIFIERKKRRRMIQELIRNGANYIEVIDRIQMELDRRASPELRYCLRDVLKFMALKKDEHHEVNIDELRLNHLQFYRHCLNEIVLLKEEKLSDYLTYYDFVAKNNDELSKYVGNKNIKKAFKNISKLTYMFPIYSEILLSHFEEATEKRQLREAARTSLSYAIPCINAGHIVTYEILNFIEIVDMKNIVQACLSVKF